MPNRRAPIRGRVRLPERAPRRRERAQAAVTLGEPLSHPGPSVGRALRALRTQRDLSLRLLAQQSGLSVNTLSLIENSKTSPSVATLQQLALALDVPITAFFETGEPKNRLAYIKASQRRGAAFAHGSLEDLGVGLSERTIEPFVVTIKPSAGSGAQPIVHTGQEFVYCLEGRITYTVEDQTYLLEPGDSLLFESPLPHRWHNVDAAPAKMLLVLTPADARDQPARHHFAPE
ncbi:MAG: cupin domain-containing protein [Chloroflexi bacterium]|nr:cupin domain-containing protein [Chloroflexota bacterium]